MSEELSESKNTESSEIVLPEQSSPSVIVPDASEFQPVQLVDEEFQREIATRGQQERMRPLSARIIITFFVTLTFFFLAGIANLPVVPTYVTAVFLIWFVGWLLTNQVTTALQQRQYDRVHQLLPRALGYTMSTMPFGAVDFSKCFNAQFMLLMFEGRYIEFEILSRYAWAYNEKQVVTSGLPKHWAIATNLALSLMLQGRFGDAAEIFRQLLAQAKRKDARAIVLNNLAFCLSQDKKPDEAELYYNEALELNGSKLDGERGMRLQLIYAYIQFGKKNLEAAEVAIERSRDIATKIKIPFDFFSNYESLLALIRKDQGRYDEAEMYFKNSLNILESSNNPNYFELAKLHRCYAEFLVESGNPTAANEQIIRAHQAYDTYVEREQRTVAQIKKRLKNNKRIAIGTDLLQHSERISTIEMH